jgi:hypothetical protein
VVLAAGRGEDGGPVYGADPRRAMIAARHRSPAPARAGGLAVRPPSSPGDHEAFSYREDFSLAFSGDRRNALLFFLE